MNEWWQELSTVLRVLYCVAIPSLLLAVIQIILSALGFGGAADVNISDTTGLDLEPDLPQSNTDVQTSLDGLQLITMQGIVIFLTIFSWTSIVFISFNLPVFLACLFGAMAGFAAMYGAAVLIRAMYGLSHNGAVDLKNAVGEVAEVYLAIPPKGEGAGKVTLNVQGRFMECDAITNEQETLSTSSSVRVIDLQGDTLVVAAKL